MKNFPSAPTVQGTTRALLPNVPKLSPDRYGEIWGDDKIHDFPRFGRHGETFSKSSPRPNHHSGVTHTCAPAQP